MEGESEREFWRQQQSEATAQGAHWVPHVMTVSLSDDGQLSVVEGETAEHKVWEISEHTCIIILPTSRMGVWCMS